MIDKVKKGSQFINRFNMFDALCEVSQYAYCQTCAGLTKEECETLEKLCDKAAFALASEVAEVIIHE